LVSLGKATLYYEREKMKKAIAIVLAALAPVFMSTGPASASTTKTVYITGYSIYDNDPPGSKEVAYPGFHKEAGGIGTYADPITVAVGQLSGVLQYDVGTRIYIPAYRRYFIVEDLCAACGSLGANWIDVWVGGEQVSQSVADACMNKITGNHAIVVSPPSNYRVSSTGDIAHKVGNVERCIKLWDEDPHTV
jgi:hypothetical protein